MSAAMPVSIHDLHDDLLATIFLKAMGVDSIVDNAVYHCGKGDNEDGGQFEAVNFGLIFTLQKVCRHWHRVVQDSKLLWAAIVVGPCSEFCAFRPCAKAWRRIFQWLAPHSSCFLNLRLVGRAENSDAADADSSDNSSDYLADIGDCDGFPNPHLDEMKLVALSMLGYNVRVLDLENFFHPEIGAQLLDVLVRMKSLQELHVSYVRQDFIDEISSLQCLHRLQTLDLEADAMNSVVLDLEWLPTHLECLSLSDLEMEPPPESLISQWSKLEALDLCGVNWSGGFFEVVCAFPALKVLCIEDCDIQGDASPSPRAPVLQKLEKLERLELIKENNSEHFVSEIESYLDGISYLKNLRTLQVIVEVDDTLGTWYWEANFSGLLDGLSALTSLTELCLEGLGLGHVPQAICEHSSLKRLSLADNRLEELPADHLLAGLKSVKLDGNPCCM